MSPRIILFVLLLSSGCSAGLLPCPTAKSARLKKTHANKPLRQFMASMSAKANTDEEQSNIHHKSSRSNSNDSFDNISVEEWDCPRPGAKKYMPKEVKNNIKKNFHKINKDPKPAADSLSVP